MSAGEAPRTGRVFLVGAGPGDPGLITVKGLEVLKRADVVLYDALADERLLAHAPAASTKILVGKRHGRDSVPQADIESLMLEHALAGRLVVRLKGGDPFIFGRGGEEAEACRRAGVPFEVVPGVTSAIAAPAHAGIPLTHREHSSLVTFVTGQPGGARPGYDIDFGALARTGGTLVFLMAMTRIGEIAAKLVDAGMSPDTPVAGVRWGTLPRRTKLVTTLARVGEEAPKVLVRPPVVFVVGDVAALAGRLDWYEDLPLHGRRIVVTRARSQASSLASRLEALGAEVLEVPTIETRRLEVPAEALERAATSDWLVLTSVNGVEAFFGLFLEAGFDLRRLAGVRLAAIGPATRAAIEARGIRVDAMGAEYRAESLLEALGEVAGRRILVARAETAREVLPEGLRERGAEVEVLPVYRTSIPDPRPALPAAGGFDAITFTSSSTVTNLDALCGGRAKELVAGAVVASIGPITSATARGLGLRVDLEAAEYTIDGLVAAIVDRFANRQGVP